MTGVFDPDAWINARIGSPRRGTPLSDPSVRTRPADLVAAVASFLTSLHAEPPGDGPCRSPQAMLDLAVAEHSESDAGLLDGARALCPADPDVSVITFGGLRLDALEIDAGQVCGWRAGRHAGVGDPAWDVATAAGQLAEMVGPEGPALLVDHYGGPPPELLRLEFWALIDRLV